MSNTKLDVRVYPIDEPMGSTKAFASVALDDMVAIRGIRIVEGEKGLFVSMPQSYDKKNEEYHDIAFPIDSDVRKEVNKAVKEEYKRVEKLPSEQRGYDKPGRMASRRDFEGADGSTAPESADQPETGAMNGININDVKLDIKIYPIKEPQGNTKAFANINIDDLVEIRGVRVVDGEKGLFVTMPQSQDKKTNDYHDVAFPINGDLRKEVTKAVMDKYENGDKSLANGLKQGAEKASQSTAAPRESVAKSKNTGVLE